MEHSDFNPNLHPRDLVGKFSRGGGGDKSLVTHLNAKIADNDRTRKPRLRATDIMVGGRVMDSSEIAPQPLSATAQAAQNEGRKWANIDMKWPTPQDFPITDKNRAVRARARDDLAVKQRFIATQFDRALGRGELNTDKLHPASVAQIAAHIGKPLDEVAAALAEIEARGGIVGDPTKGYYITKVIGAFK